MHMRNAVSGLLTMTGVAFGMAGPARAAAFIVQDGAPKAQIVIAEQPTRMQKVAAEELQKYVRKISGAELPIMTAPTDTQAIKLYVGQSASTDKLGLKNEDLEHGAYRMKSGPDYLVLLGKDTNYFQDEPSSAGEVYPTSRADRKRAAEAWEKQNGDRWGTPFMSSFKGYHAKLGLWANDEHGSLNAVNDFLRSLGVEWYMPGDFGEILPEMTSIQIPDVDRTVRPEVATRSMGFYYNAPFMASEDEFLWQLRLGFNPNGDIGGHGIANMLATAKVKQEHPEYFALYGGERETESRGGKPCCSSSGLLASGIGFAKLMFDEYDWDIVSLMPTDGYSALCGCPLCQGRGTPDRGPQGSLSDYVWKFINDAGRAIEKTHPDKQISCNAYGAYLLPPDTIEQLSPNVAIGICQWRSGFYQSEIRQLYLDIREGWLQRLPVKKFSIWEYYLHGRPDGSWSGIPVYYPRLIAEDLRALKGMLNGEGIEVARNFSSGSNSNPDPALAVNHLNCWLTARLWWDPDQNIDSLLDRYYKDFYGPAAAEMKSFIEFSETSWPVLNQESEPVGKALKLLDQAHQAVGQDSLYAQRVQLVVDYVRPALSQIYDRLTIKRADVPYTRLGDFWSKSDYKTDANLEDEFWKHTSYCNVALSECQTGRAPHLATSIQAVWAFGALHFKIYCQESDTATLNTPTIRKDDMAIFEGDYVTLLLASPCHNYYEIAVAPNGAWIDIDRKGGTNIAWSSHAEVATRIGDGYWCAEIRLPVLDEGQVDVDPDHNGVAGGKPNPTFPWFFNYGRQRKRDLETEYSARYPTGGTNFHDPFYFGKLGVRR